MRRQLLSLLACSLLSVDAAQATDIYRWVDDNGRTQLSDVVPEKYRARATTVDSARYELSPVDRALAEARAQRQRPLEAAASGAAPRGAAPGLGRSPRSPMADCATWQRLYTRSQECFARYKTVNGATKAEAFQKCTEIPDPATQCGHARLP